MKKIWNGMPNGGTDINDNFNEVVKDYLKNDSNQTIKGEMTFAKHVNFTKKYDEIIIGGGLSAHFTRVNDVVQICIRGTINGVKTGQEMSGKDFKWVPQEYTSDDIIHVVGNIVGEGQSFSIDIEPTGRCVWYGTTRNNGVPRCVATYLTNKPLQSKD